VSDATPRLAAPSPWVERFFGGIPPGGRVLDVACGSGRHLAYGLELGRTMVGIDRDVAGARRRCADMADLALIEVDLEDGRPFPFPPSTFDGVIVTNYLWRPILSDIIAAVAPGGVLIYETFAIGQERFGRPSNPEFLLRPGELLQAVVPRLKVIAFEHVRLGGPDRIVQRIAAVGAAHRWPADDTPGL
jgi:SAM-dependent methyltransferase